jgi:glycosyltransferase involved in cell wall biosynthesis
MTHITVCIRARNEAKIIARCLRSYSWADRILVADGGSEDDTKIIASRFKNVLVDDFAERVYGTNGIWRNPEGRHLNFLYNWARELGTDWIITDECDSLPTLDLQEHARDLFQVAYDNNKQGILLHRVYLWGADEYFPNLSESKKKWTWAWRSTCPMKARDSEEWGVIWDNIPPENQCDYWEPPFAALHNFCPDTATVERKLKFYQDNGHMPGVPHPLEMGSHLEPKLPWMTDWK